MAGERGVCVVVGAGPGIGLAVARRFGEGGYALGLIARNDSDLQNMAGGLEFDGYKALPVCADVARAAHLTSAVREIERKLGRVEVLVYNAVSSKGTVASALEPLQLEHTLQVNVSGALAAAQTVIPAMRERGRGTLLFTGGGLALRPNPQLASLSVGKAALRTMVGLLALELAPSGVHVGTVTVAGRVEPGTAFDPDLIAEKFWELHCQPPGRWQAEIVFNGEPVPA